MKEHNLPVALLDCMSRTYNRAWFKKIVVWQEGFPDLLRQSRTRYCNAKPFYDGTFTR